MAKRMAEWQNGRKWIHSNTCVLFTVHADDDDTNDDSLIFYSIEELTHQNLKTILLTDASTDEGEDDVAKYFKVQKQWNELLFQWKEEGKVIIGFERY
jgi:hypothetical protein